MIAVKPSLGFLALAGVRHRSWWLGIPVLAALALPFGTLWIEWVRVVVNSPGDFTYSLANVPYLVAPLAAWVGRRDAQQSRAEAPHQPLRSSTPTDLDGAMLARDGVEQLEA